LALSILSSVAGGDLDTLGHGALAQAAPEILDGVAAAGAKRGTYSIPAQSRLSRSSSVSFGGLYPLAGAAPARLPGVFLEDLPTLSRSYEVRKRIFDLSLAILIFPVVAVLIALIANMIALTSGGPVFFRQPRIGRHGRVFHIWKFRTMRHHSERVLAEHLMRDAAAREEWRLTHKLRDDPRVTRLGRFLRKTSLDELPQIFNIFAGNMSFVGPRPIVQAETVRYAERFACYLAALPGITGLWQVSGRCNVSYEARIDFDETYVRRWTMTRDLWILLKTPRAVFCRSGAY
jgi:lipopolysaccharide/colanic/teichoic acid biosynthesis glycosyltransferase